MLENNVTNNSLLNTPKSKNKSARWKSQKQSMYKLKNILSSYKNLRKKTDLKMELK